MNEYIKDVLTAELEEEKKVIMRDVERAAHHYATLATKYDEGGDKETAGECFALWRFYNKLATALNELQPAAGGVDEIRFIF